VNATTVCPDGKYSLPGSDDPGDCNCPNGSSSRQNARYVTECICSSGYYKEYSGFYPLGGWYCRLCQVGEFCFNNTNRTCPAFSTSFGVARSYQDCFCNRGYRNASIRTEEAFCENCPANYYCTGKGSVEACTANAISPTQSQDQTRCYCDLGWKGLNNTPCVACQSPTFCYGGVQAQCSEGTFSPALAWDRLNCSCIPGRWGPAGGPCILCGAGKYNLYPGCKACSNTSDVDCELCALGTASTSLGRNTTCDVCGAGTYSFPANTRGAQTCEPCGTGFAAPPGSSNCTACLSGQYAAAGFSACVACPAGTYSPVRASSCTLCPANTWSSSQQSKCTANTGFYDVDTSLRAYYPFNQGDFLTDVTGMTGNLVASSSPPTQQASGPFGAGSYSAYLDASGSTGVSSTSQFFSLPSLLLPNAMSICTWFWMSPSITTGNSFILDFGFFGMIKNIQFLTQNGNFRVELMNDASIGSIILTNAVSTTQVWRHTCLTVANTAAVLWLDGNPTAITMTGARDFSRLLTSNFIGRSNFNGQAVWWGALDEFRIYHKALSATEVAALNAFRGDTTSPMLILGCPNPCNAGTYGGCLGDGTQNCSFCAAGMYSSGTGQTSVSACQSCLTGTFSLTGASACSGCLAGTYGTGLGFTSSGLCTACGTGTYQTGLGYTSQGACTTCQSGTYSTGLGMTAGSVCTNCSTCTTGQYNVSNCNSSANIVCGACENPIYFYTTRHYFTSTGLNGPTSCSWLCNPGLERALSTTYGSNGCWDCGFSNGAWCYYGIKNLCPNNTIQTGWTNRYQTNCKCAAGFVGDGGWNTTWQQYPVGIQLQPPANWSGVNCEACPAGKYNTGTGVTSSSQCISCIAGTYSTTLASQNSSSCLSCQPGTYQTGTGMQNSLACTLCQPGTYSTGMGMTISSKCLLCQSGTYSTSTGASAGSTCQMCIAGRFGTMLGSPKSGNCDECDWGTFSTLLGAPSRSNCSLCIAGTYSSFSGSSSSNSCISCQQGSYSSIQGAYSSNACQACVSGTFASSTGTSRCQPCPEGSFTPVNASTNCSFCGLGVYSYAGMSSCLACQAGKYKEYEGCFFCSNSTDADCQACFPGSASSILARQTRCDWCEPGYFASTSGSQTCSPCGNGSIALGAAQACFSCPLGNFAPIGSSACTPCPPDTYLDVPYQGSITSCKQCPAGKVSPYTGAQTVLACTACFPGKYKLLEECQLCETGKYSSIAGTTTCSACSNGTISASGASACLTCLLGTYAPVGTGVCLDCPFHTYLDYPYAGSASECKPCPPGTWSWMFATPSLDMCYPCQPGTYELNRNCQDCTAGSFSGLQATACLACPPGLYSGIRAGNCTLCPAGSFSDRSNTSSCLICPPGTFSQPGSSTCQPCPIAEFSASPNATACQSCPAGSYSDQTGGTNCTECGPGTFSTGNASACQSCPYGTSHNTTNQSECQPCRNGTFAPPGSLEVSPSDHAMVWILASHNIRHHFPFLPPSLLL
jgi:hypothetical protein